MGCRNNNNQQGKYVLSVSPDYVKVRVILDINITVIALSLDSSLSYKEGQVFGLQPLADNSKSLRGIN